MKRFIIILTAIMFLANTYIVSAWAKPCINMNAPNAVTAKSLDTVATPCPMSEHTQKHYNEADGDGEAEKMIGQHEHTPNTHCDGLCFCLHASLYQVPIVTLSDKLILLSKQSNYTLVYRSLGAAQSVLPLHEPPKTTS